LDGSDLEDSSQHPLTSAPHSSANGAAPSRRSFVQSFDAEIMSPIFGGPKRRPVTSTDTEDDADLHFDLNLVVAGDHGEGH